MLKFVGRRVLATVPLLFLVSFAAFGLVELAPGDAALNLAGDYATPDTVERIRSSLGLGDPFFLRYWHFLGHALTGDLGSSLQSSVKVVSIIWDRVPVTLSLVCGAMFLAIVLGVPIGVYSAMRRGSWVDRAVSATTALAISIPGFILGNYLIKLFALNLGWFPATGYIGITSSPGQWLHHLVLPALSLSLLSLAEIARLVRAAVSDTLSRDYVQTAWAKGLTQREVVVKHTLKNAAIPVVTIVGVQTGRLIGATVIVERVFAMNGMGSLVIDSVQNRDAPLIQGLVLMTAIVVLSINLLVDISYGYFNPRLRS